MTRWWRCGTAAAVLLCLLAPTAVATAARPAEPVDLGGTPVEVSTDPNDPTVLTAGLWSDTLTGPGGPDANVHRFRYARTMADSTVLIAVVATSLDEGGDGVQVDAYASDGSPCGSSSSSSGYAATESAYGALVVVRADELGERDSPCLKTETVEIAVSRGTSGYTSDLPIALRIVEEAPVVDVAADLPPPAETPSVPFPDPGEPTAVTGAPSFDDAPTIEPGTYRDAVPEGTERLYRVRLDWGQALAVRVDSVTDRALLRSLDGDTPTVNLTLFDPLRNSFGDVVVDSVRESTYDEDGFRLVDGSPAVAYLNRYDDQPATVPGEYWVSLAAAPADDDRPAVDVPVELTVQVLGEPAAPPEFSLTVQGPRGSAGPDGYDPRTPYLVDAGRFSAEVSGTPRGPAGPARGGSDDGSLTPRRVAGLVVGAVSLVACAAGVVLLRRRVRPAAAR